MKYSQSVCAINSFESLKILDELSNSGMTHIHIDFMDSFYVPSFGFSFEQAKFLIERFNHINFDAHLMTKKPLRLIEKLIQVGFKTIFMPANEISLEDFVDATKNYPNICFGIMLEANNNPEDFRNIILNSKKILLMTIDKIGGTGQKLNNLLFSKVNTIKQINKSIEIYSDGGLRVTNSDEFYQNNIDVAVGGSIIYSFDSANKFMKWWIDKYDS
ncbi:hypothetical protein [Mycoplasma sp. 1012]